LRERDPEDERRERHAATPILPELFLVWANSTISAVDRERKNHAKHLRIGLAQVASVAGAGRTMIAHDATSVHSHLHVFDPEDAA
jgi:hypothetical protein